MTSNTGPPFKLIDIELSRPLPAIGALDGYRAVRALLRLYGAPVGYVTIPVVSDPCPGAHLAEAIVSQQGKTLWRRLGQVGEPPDDLQLGDLAELIAATEEPVDDVDPWPTVTIAVCTRDRPEMLARCLDSLERVDYPSFDVLVVDNAPSADRTRDLVATRSGSVRRVLEPSPGLSRARNRAIIHATGEIVAFTDDDVDVDPAWLRSLVTAFARHDAMVVTGLVVPAELDTEAQVFLERYGGFGSGMDEAVFRQGAGRAEPSVAALECGTGANMAYRRRVFTEVGLFDPGLGAGTPTGGGEELEMFFRVLKAGYAVAYEPAAIVRHGHHRATSQLRRQLASWGTGFTAYCLTCARRYPEDRRAFVSLGLKWLVWQARRLSSSVVRRLGFPRTLILVEVGGAIKGVWTYMKARRQLSADGPEWTEQASGHR